jgi:hypothetical protein
MKFEPSEIQDVFSYETDTGILRWKISGIGGSKLGGVAGCVWGDGYRYIRYKKSLLLAHRVAFAVHYGRWPNQVDHINLNRSDNRLCNIREATNAQNNRNKSVQSNNTSGFKGVTFNRATNKFQAKITLDGKTRSLGYFSTAEDASAKYNIAAKEIHGEYARA